MAALQAGLTTLLEYLSAHVLTCLIPAFFIAGAIAALLKTEMVLKYFGADAPKWLCYSVAATSGTILAVCSCTILPMFAGIEKKGAGIGPATAFLFSGPAINLLAIVLTARVLGLDLGIARAVAAVSMAVIIGLIMAAIFERGRKKCEIPPNNAPAQAIQATTEPQKSGRTERISVLFIALLIGVLLSATSKLEFSTEMDDSSCIHSGCCFCPDKIFLLRREERLLQRDLVSDQEDLSPTGGWNLHNGHYWLLYAHRAAQDLFRLEQLPGVLYSLYYRGFALYADPAGGTNSRDAVRLQHRNNCCRSGAFSAPGRAIVEPTKHDSDHENHRPKERWCLLQPGRDSLHSRGYALRSNCLII